MVLSPLEIQKKEFKKVFRGYCQREVRDYLEEVTKNYEKMYTTNRELQDQINDLEDRIEYFKGLEGTLKDTLILAEKTANEVKHNAKNEGELILKGAMEKASKIIETAESKCNDINSDMEELRRHFYLYKTRFTNFLKSQLELVDGFEAIEKKGFKNIDIDFNEVASSRDIEPEDDNLTEDQIQ